MKSAIHIRALIAAAWHAARMTTAEGTAHATYNAAIMADDAWGDELRRLFGKTAGDVRYTRRGKGAPGSHLRHLHDARGIANARLFQKAGGQ